MRTKALLDFCSWLEQTPFSVAIQSTSWIVPAVQTVHILAIAAVMSSALMIALRGESRFRPVIWWALPVLLATGVVMIVGEPARSLANPVFQIKMLLLLGAITVTVALRKLPAAGVVSLALWVGIVFAGRWIAYF